MNTLAFLIRFVSLLTGLTLLFMAIFVLHLPFPFSSDARGIVLALSIIYYFLVIFYSSIFALKNKIKEVTEKNKNLAKIIFVAFSSILIGLLYKLINDPTVISPF